jgi:hypothetical protein
MSIVDLADFGRAVSRIPAPNGLSASLVFAVENIVYVGNDPLDQFAGDDGRTDEKPILSVPRLVR